MSVSVYSLEVVGYYGKPSFSHKSVPLRGIATSTTSNGVKGTTFVKESTYQYIQRIFQYGFLDFWGYSNPSKFLS
jgi:hypothetical protein